MMKEFLKEHPYFENMRKHHDAHETLMSIIDSLDEGMKPLNYMKQIFDTKLVIEVKCKSCNKIEYICMFFRRHTNQKNAYRKDDRISPTSNRSRLYNWEKCRRKFRNHRQC